MMKKIYGLILLMFTLFSLLSCGSSSKIVFSDDNLEKAIRTILKMPDQDIYTSDVQDITVLNLEGQNIAFLDGLEHFSSLEKLNLENNIVKDLSPLEEVTSLSWLSLRNNQILNLNEINFDAITKHPLTYLSLRHNVVGDRDDEIRLSNIGVLEKLTLLESLELRDNHITDISAIEGLIHLSYLDISQNPIEDSSLRSLRYLLNLEHLNIRETNAENLDVLASLTRLKYLNIHSNVDVISVSFLSSLIKLETLIAANVSIGSQIEVLSTLTNLMELNLENTFITDISVLLTLMLDGALQDNSFGQLATVNISRNSISTQSYEQLESYWSNITFRVPIFLPTQNIVTPLLNEFMASNGASIRDFEGDNEDWIELYNPSNEPYDIGGYYLSDDAEDLQKWQFPEGTIIPSNGFLLVFASGKNMVATNGELHTNFRIDSMGESLFFIYKDGQSIFDFVDNIEVPRNYSYGRKEDGLNDWVYFDWVNTTPNATNDFSTPYDE